MKIKIAEENASKIEELLTAAQKGCTQRLLTVADIEGFSTYMEKFLDRWQVPLKARLGCRYVYQEAICYNNYGHRAQATTVTIMRGSRDWFIMRLCREDTDVGRGSASEWFAPSYAAIEVVKSTSERLFRDKRPPMGE